MSDMRGNEKSAIYCTSDRHGKLPDKFRDRYRGLHNACFRNPVTIFSILTEFIRKIARRDAPKGLHTIACFDATDYPALLPLEGHDTGGHGRPYLAQGQPLYPGPSDTRILSKRRLESAETPESTGSSWRIPRSPRGWRRDPIVSIQRPRTRNLRRGR